MKFFSALTGPRSGRAEATLQVLRIPGHGEAGHEETESDEDIQLRRQALPFGIRENGLTDASNPMIRTSFT